MSETNSKQDMDKALFINLVMMFTSSAMQQLGKLIDPSTNKVEIDLQGAQVSIDMLDMLRKKTAGNLDKDEERMLGEALASLQMNYVQVAKEQPQGDAKSAPQATTPPAAEAAASDGKAGEPVAPEIKKEPGAQPKYHKSYGG